MLVLIPIEQLAVRAERLEQVEWFDTVRLKVLTKKFLWTTRPEHFTVDVDLPRAIERMMRRVHLERQRPWN